MNPVDVVLGLSELDIAKGQILQYFQAKGTHKVIPVVAQAARIPLYGAGNGLPSVDNSKQGVPLSMVATLHSQYYVVGKMIKPKYQNQVACNIVLDSTTMALLTPLKTSCIYDP